MPLRVRRVLKFGVVGVLNTAVDFALYIFLTNSLTIWPVLSNLASYTAGVVNSFALNRRWTFADGEYRDGLAYQFPVFLLVNVSGLLLTTGAIWLALFWLEPVPAKTVSVPLTLFWNYWFSKNFVFRHKSHTIPKSLIYRSLTGYGGAVIAFLGLAILANAFAVYYMTQERYVYFWDLAYYWVYYRDITASLAQHPFATLGSLIGSIRTSDYNPLPVLPLVPLGWLFGTNRLPYILAITNLYLLPAALVMGFLVQRLFHPQSPGRPFLPFVLATTSILFLHMLWAAVLRGYPDVVGVVFIGCILLLHFGKPFAEQGLGRLVTTGVLLCLLVLLRRWYAYWVVAFFPALAVAHALDLYQRHGIAWRQYLTASRNLVIIGLTFTLALFGFATPFALRAIQTDYSDIYSTYRFSGSLVDAAELLPAMFGWVEIVTGLGGLIWLTVCKETRVAGSLLLIQFFIVFVLFARTQDFGVQHHYLLVSSIAIGIATVIIGLWERITNGLWRAASVGLVLTALLLSSVTVFAPGAASIGDRCDSLLPSHRFYPLVRDDIDVLENLLAHIEELQLDQPGEVYVLASSRVLNSAILQNACKLGPRHRWFCDRILNTHDVDKRDGFPRQFPQAQYLVIADPTQYHLRPEDQRVIGVLAREVMQGHGIGAAFQRLPGEFKFDKGVMVWIYAKVRPFEKADLEALEAEFNGYDPNKRHLFSVR
ncbi:MAG TPA: GtrA family protein [Methylococcus sp.]|nr:GtrA family protein [Methylococcus sp.]